MFWQDIAHNGTNTTEMSPLDCLCKGMLLVDPTLQGEIRLQKDCIKVCWAQRT